MGGMSRLQGGGWAFHINKGDVVRAIACAMALREETLRCTSDDVSKDLVAVATDVRAVEDAIERDLEIQRRLRTDDEVSLWSILDN